MNLENFLNERSSAPKMLTIGALVKVLKDDKKWKEVQDHISSFFEDGSWSKGDYVTSTILELMYGDDWGWQDDYDLPNKKATWATADKRLRGALKKLDKEYIISKADCYKRIKQALSNDGDIFSDIIYAIRDTKKNSGVKVKYPKFNNYRDVESWMNEFRFTDSLARSCSKDDICLLMSEGIDSISITEIEHDEYISASSRTSTWTIEYKVDIVSYTTNKVLSFNIEKSTTDRL